MDMSTVRNVAILAFLLGSAYLAYMNRDRLLRFLISKQEKKPKRKEKPRDAMKEVCETFLLYADNFQGLFEPMYKVSIGTISMERMRNVLKEWDIRMGGIVQAPICLRSWWATVITNIDTLSMDELQNRSKLVVEMIHACGIVRDSQTELVAKENTGLYYQHADGKQLVVGQTVRVESPCWYLPVSPVRIIEKGYCEI